MAIWTWVKEHKSSLAITITGVIAAWVLGGFKPSGVASGILSFLAVMLPLPVWVAMLFSFAVATCLALLARARNRAVKLTNDLLRQQSDASARAADLQAEIEELRNPTQPTLTEDETKTLFWTSIFHDQNDQLYNHQLAKLLNTRLVHVDSFADQLKQKGLLWNFSNPNERLEITSKGRAYMSQPEVAAAYKEFIDR